MSEPFDPALYPPRATGFVGLAGVPNVGKSTLVNKIVGQKVSIVSDRPQTTRERICGIFTGERLQVALVDIPGILDPKDRFNESLMAWAELGIAGCDLVLHLRDARRPKDPADLPVQDMVRRSAKPVWLVWNKIDRVPGKMFPAHCEDLPYQKVFGIAAKSGRGVPELVEALALTLPRGPLMYDPEQVCDRDLRFLVAELVREKLFRYLGQEIPYATAAVTEQFDEERGEKLYLRVDILTERKAHKPIILGRDGEMIKKIGQAARREIETLCGRPVYLELWVRIAPKWRKNEQQLLELGLRPPSRR
jgi:GTP-binding protein Era